MNNKKLKQLVKEALSNMIDEDDTLPQKEALEKAVNYYNQNAGSVSMEDAAKKFNVSEFDVIMALNKGAINFQEDVDPGTKELEGALGDENFDTAISANELYSPIDDDDSDLGGSIKTKSITSKAGETTTQADDHFQNVEETDMGGGDPAADALANQLMMMSDTDLEEETHSLREFFDLDEMARPTKQYKLTGRIEDVERFLRLVNDKIKAGSIKKLFGRGSKQGKNPIPFSEEEIDSILNIIQNQETFTAKDFIGRTDDEGNQIGVRRFKIVQQPNAILKALSDEIIGKDEETGDLITGKNYIQSTMGIFVKNAEPDTSAEPKRRGRPPAPKPPSPEDEFDAPEMEPEMAPDDDPVVQQATQAQAQAQDPKKQAVKSFMDQMKAMGVISDTNKVLDMDTYKDEFAKFKSTMNETLNESKKSKKGLLTERFQQLAGIKPIYAINSLNEDENEVERIRTYLIKQMKNKEVVSSEDKKKFLEKFLSGQAPVGFDGKTRMEDRKKAAQSLLDEL